MLSQWRVAPLVLMAILGASEIRAQEPSTPKTDSSVAIDSSIFEIGSRQPCRSRSTASGTRRMPRSLPESERHARSTIPQL